MDVKQKIALSSPDISSDFIALCKDTKTSIWSGSDLDDEKTLEDCEIEPFHTLRVEKIIWIRLHYYNMDRYDEFRHVTRSNLKTVFDLKKSLITTVRLKKGKKTIELNEPTLYDDDLLVNINERLLNFVVNEKKNTCVIT